MDFNDTPEEARFREEASSWLAENAPTDDAFRALSPLEQAKVWQKRKYDAGWACIGWAPEFGGRGASAIEEVIWRQEESQYDLPANFCSNWPSRAKSLRSNPVRELVFSQFVCHFFLDSFDFLQSIFKSHG